MTMRLSLLIDGTSKEAVVAVDKTVAALDKLEAKSKTTGAAVATSVKTAGQGVAQAAALSTQQLGQMQYQFQDIAVGLTSGQSPFTVMMQQGSQLAQSFKAGTGPLEAIKVLGKGIALFLTNPLNLSVVAIGLAASAVQFFFSSIGQGVEKSEAALKNHEDLVKRIGASWADASGKALKYSLDTDAVLLRQAKRDAETLGKQFGEAMQTAMSRTFQGTSRAQSAAIGGVGIGEIQGAGNSQLSKASESFIKDAASGKADIKAFLSEISKISNASDSAKVHKLVDAMSRQLEEAGNLQLKLLQTNDTIKGFNGDAQAMNDALGKGTENVRSFSSALRGIDPAQFNRDRQGVDRSRPDLFSGKSILDIIGQSEGTDRGRGYNETLGYGKFTGQLELVTMNLKEILAVQGKMLANPSNTFNSSALGRYQITRETLLDFMPKLGLTETTIFSPAVQDKLANAILLSTKGSYEAFVARFASGKDVSPATFRKAYNEAAGQTSSVAQDISDVAAKRQAEANKEKERAIDIDAKWQAVLRGETSQLSGQLTVLGKSAAAIAANRKEQELLNRAHALFGETLSSDVIAQIRAEADAYGAAAGKVDAFKKAQEQQGVVAGLVLKKQQQDLADYIAQLDEGRGLIRGFVSIFVDAEVAGKSFFDSLKSAADNLLDSFLKLSETKFLDALLGKQGSGDTGILSSLFGSLFGGGDSLYAMGGAFAGGAQVQAFAKGDVFSSPTLFPMRGGKTGLLGEAGYPEAIMPLSGSMRVGVATPKGETSLPLTRLASGKLGVKADHAFADGGVFGSGNSSSGSAGGGDIKVNLVVHNSTGEKATAKAQKNQDGSLDLKVMVGNIMVERIAGGHVDAALNNRFNGLSRKTERYG